MKARYASTMDRARIGAPAGRLVEADGHTWLVPLPRSLAWRKALVVGAVAAGAGIAVAVGEAHGLGVGLAVLLLGLGVALLLWFGLWQGAHTRIGVGSVGVLVQRGARTRMLAWEAVDGIVSRVRRPAGRRVEVVVDIAGDGAVDQVVLRLRPAEATGWREAVATQASSAGQSDHG